MRYLLSAVLILIIGFLLRGFCLDIRPMHGDEAVHAYKFGRLLEENYYRYDPSEFHGPALNYLTLISAWLTGQNKYSDLTESTLRIISVIFGMLLIVLPLLLMKGISKRGALIAALIAAISPGFVFYSRYYIPEILMVFFTYAAIVCGFQYAENKKLLWAVLTGLFVGMCCVTKETWIIVFGSILVAVGILMLSRGQIWKMPKRHLLLGLSAAAFIWILFYSSFFSNPVGIIDSIMGLKMYFGVAFGNQAHFHPWFYYLKLLIYNKASMGPPWTEGAVVIAALIGILFIFFRKGLESFDTRLLDFLVVFTVIMLLIYSAIPYKTPWCLLSFYYGLILLAGVGIAVVFNLIKAILPRVIVSAFLITIAIDLIIQAFTASCISYTDQANPYVYAHPIADVLKISERIKNISQAISAGSVISIWVVCPDGDYWPLPWYLRDFKNVGWCNDVNEVQLPASVVIVRDELKDDIVERLYSISSAGSKNLYVPLFDTSIKLRPHIELEGLITKDLHDKYQKSNVER